MICNPVVVVSEAEPCNIAQCESTTSVSTLILAVGIDKEAVSHEYLLQQSLVKIDLLSEHKWHNRWNS